MRELSLQECKQIEVEILDYIHSVCKQHNLRYSLGYGTLLGAIRHKGFIPWDDDIDIIMPYDDYSHLLQILNNKCDDKYILHMPGHKGYFYEFAKISAARTVLIEHNLQPIKDYGVYVDVFPMYNAPSCLRFNRMKMWFLQKCRTASAHIEMPQYSLVKKAVVWPFWKITRLIGIEWFSCRQLRLIERITKRKSNKIMCYESGYDYLHDATIFDNLIEADFEGKRYSIIAKYDEYLKIEYGNYMQLPPVENQVSNHNYTAYFKE